MGIIFYVDKYGNIIGEGDEREIGVDQKTHL